jgi:hypothetical protein
LHTSKNCTRAQLTMGVRRGPIKGLRWSGASPSSRAFLNVVLTPKDPGIATLDGLEPRPS